MQFLPAAMWWRPQQQRQCVVLMMMLWFVTLSLCLRSVKSFCAVQAVVATTYRRTGRLPMVRNIDLPEGLILYGAEVVGSSEAPRDGLVDLLRDCREIDTATILLHEHDRPPSSIANDVVELCTHVIEQTDVPVADLIALLATVEVQPRPFGGSAGFGSQPAEPPRPVLPQRCVVLAAHLDATRAARATGMRVMAVSMEDPLADAVLMDGAIDFGVDDIATPGSFWLNPPHPRDDEGNRVDPYELIQGAGEKPGDLTDDSSIDEDDISAILSDMAPLL